MYAFAVASQAYVWVLFNAYEPVSEQALFAATSATYE